jgi:hypothetical protein
MGNIVFLIYNIYYYRFIIYNINLVFALLCTMMIKLLCGHNSFVVINFVFSKIKVLKFSLNVILFH